MKLKPDKTALYGLITQLLKLSVYLRQLITSWYHSRQLKYMTLQYLLVYISYVSQERGTVK